MLKRWSANSKKTKKISLHLEYLRLPLGALFVVFFIASAMPLMRLPAEINGIVSHILSLWVIAACSWLLVRIVHVLRDMLLSRFDINEKDNARARRLHTQIKILVQLVTAVIVIVSIGIMFMTFGKVRQIGVSLLASAGIAGIILGLAAQRTLGNLFAGLQIALTQPIKLDDVVIVEKEWGRIEEITLTYIVVCIWDRRRLIVPLSYFIERPFENWTKTSSDILGTVFIYVDYTVPVEKVREELDRILKQSNTWDGKVNGLQVTDVKERTIELRALMSAADSSKAWDLRCEVREKLLIYLQENFPHCLPHVRVETMESYNSI
jgi:small-conductance mechanosensitive channel